MFVWCGGVTFLSGGVAFLSGGVAFLSGGVAFLSGGVAFLSGGVAFLFALYYLAYNEQPPPTPHMLEYTPWATHVHIHFGTLQFMYWKMGSIKLLQEFD